MMFGTMSSSGVYHLPNELLAHIFDHPDVPNESLFNLALTSRSLHYFALSIFLARFNISAPTERSELIFRDNPPHILDALSGLRIALFVPSIKTLLCRFELVGDAGEYDIVMRHMRRLHDLMSKLTAVENVKFVGHTFSFKAGCKAGKSDNSKGPFARIKNLLAKWRSNEVAFGPGDDWIDMPHLQLCESERCSSFVNYSIDNLHSSAHSALDDVSFTTPVHDILTPHEPHLAELHLSRVRKLLPVDLLRFLARLPKLTTLHLGRDVDCIDTFDLGRFPDFPCLISLHAPAGRVFKLLSSQRKGLPRLETLTIVYKLRNDGLSHWLHRSSASSIPILLQEQQRQLTVSLIIHLGNSPGWRMLEDLESEAGALFDSERPELDNITTLTLVFDSELESDDLSLASVLPKWLALFFGLRHLAIKTQSKGLPNVRVITALMAQILREAGLAEISSVEVNGVVVDSQIDN